MSVLSDSLNKWYSKPIEAPAIVQSPAAAETAQNPNTGQTIYDMVKEYGKPYSYEQELREAERSRKLGMLNDFIKSATDFGSALAGRRIFSNTESATKQANDRFDKIRDLQRQGTINYQNALLNARLKDAEIARNEAQRKAQLDLQRQNMANEQYWKQKDYDRNLAKDKANMEYNLLVEQGRNRRAADSNRIRKEEGEANRQNTLRAAHVRSNTGSSNVPVEFVGANGRKTILSKAASNAFVPVLFKRMQELVKERPGASPIEDIKLQFGESGTTADKMRMEVQKRLPDFPELQQWVEQMEVLNRMYPNATPEEWDKILRGEDLTIKTWSPDMEQQPKQEEKKEQEYILFDPNK